MILNKAIKNISALMLLASLGACSNNELQELSKENDNSPKTIKVTTNFARSTTEFDKTKSFYLYIDQSDDTNDYFVKMKYEGSQWVAYDIDGTSPVEMKLYDDAEEVKVAALYTSNNLSKDEFLSEYNDFNLSEDVLFANSLTAGSTNLNDNGNLIITFKHLYSQFDLSLNILDDQIGNVKTITVKGLNNSFSWKPTTSLTSLSLSSDVEIPIITKTLSEEEKDGTNFIFTVVPQTVSSDDFSVDVEMENGNIYTSNYSNGANLEFVAGAGCSLVLNLGEEKQTASLSSLNVISWKIAQDYNGFVIK